MKIISDIERHLENYEKIDIFFDAYSFTTENISGYIKYFDLKNKSLLTVGSSGDQVINASLEGCEDITVCDICPLTKYYYYLKVASLLVLNRDLFMKFLCETNYNLENNPYLYNRQTFDSIKSTLKKLDYDSYYVWEYLFMNYNKFDLNRLFRNDITMKDTIVHCNNYLKNDNNYKHIKSLIMNTNVKFITNDISKEKYDRYFDNIWLSNVAHYLSGEQIVNMFYNTENVLNENGKMLLCYYWNADMSFRDFIIDEFEYIESKKEIIPGISTYQDNGILLYEKTKRLH